MYNQKIVNTALIILLSVLAIPFVANQPVDALEIKPKSEFNIVALENSQVDNLNLPSSIIVSPIFLPGDLVIQDSEWYEGLFYYMANRLNQKDFVAHYFLSNDGQVFAGNSKGDEQRLNIEDPEGNKPILIMYLADKGQTDFTINAKSSLAELILDIANRNAIKLTNVQLRSLNFVLAPEKPLAMVPEQLGGIFEISLKQITTSLIPKYAPIIKNYNVELVKLENPTTAVNVDDIVKLKATIRNNSDFTLYQGTDYEPILTKKDDKSSIFFLNKTWLSQTQTPIMTEGSFVKPKEEKTFEFSINIPLYFGKQSEEFYIENILGQSYSSTANTITLEVNRPNFKVVEITDTETGQLNVRDGPWASSSVISKVTPGQRYKVLEQTTSGYTKLDLGLGKTGWVVTRYTKTV